MPNFRTAATNSNIPAVSAWRRAVAWLMSCLMYIAPPIAHAQQVTGNVIIPDGRTATQVVGSGNRTDITTRTTSGANAFNSFSQFKVGSGNTVNLHLPNGTSTLINVVRDGPVVVDGVLNSYKAGKIGGGVYFADPFGFVVGAGGVVNVGSLTVTTPTRQFIDKLIDPSGQIGSAALNQLFAGSIPISPDGAVVINGRVNTLEGARIIGHSVHVGGPAAGSASLAQASTFASTVNSRGMRSGGAIVARNGSIEIVAAGAAKIDGRLSARGAEGRRGGSIAISSGDDISVGSSAKLSVAGRGALSDGGSIVVKAGRNLDVTTGARFDARAGVTGAGGFIELSAVKTVDIGGAVVKLDGGAGGAAGTLLIDPTDLVVSSTLTSGANLVLQATNSITVGNGVTIDTRKQNPQGDSTGNSGNITLEAPNITIGTGAMLRADVNRPNYTAGDISLIARKSETLPSGPASATTSISVAGTLIGRNVQISAESTAVSSYIDDAAGLATLVAGAGFGMLTGFNGGYVAASSQASIAIQSGASITAVGNVTINAKGTEKATAPAITISNNRAAEAAVMFGEISSNVSARVEAGATITAGGNVSVLATNEATLGVSALTVSTQGTPYGGAVAYGKTRISTDAAIMGGASITTPGQVAVLARNDNDFSVSASVKVLGNAKAGAAIGLSDFDAAASAHLGASLGSAGSNVGSVLVEADSLTSRNVTKSSVTVGDNFLISGVRTVAAPAAGAVSNVASSATGSSAASKNASAETPRFAGSVTVASSNVEASADISADSGQAAPRIYSSGNVAVLSSVTEKQFRANSDSSVNSEASKPTPSQPEATVSVSVAVTAAKFDHISTAYIGDGAAITAQNIGVGAETNLPLEIFNLKWNNTHEVMTSLSNVLNGSGGVVANVLTGYANATTKATEIGIAGAVNYIDIGNQTTAWVGHGVSLTQLAGAGMGAPNWTGPSVNFQLAGSTETSRGAAYVWKSPVAVQASNYIETINIGGNISWLTIFGVSGQATDATAVGGAANVVAYRNDTIAGISDGAVINAAGGLTVNASSDNRSVSIAPTSGKGAGIAGNGVVAMTFIDNTTHASISNRAQVSAPTVSVLATQALALTTVSGGLMAANDAAVGISVSYGEMSIDTAAYIGANSHEVLGRSVTAAIDPLAGTTTSAGFVKTNSLGVRGITVVDADTLAVAATYASNTPSSPGTGLLGSISSKASNFFFSSKAKNPAASADYGLAFSGSSSVGVSVVATSAYISGANIDRLGATGQNDTTVEAVSNIVATSASGSAAIDKSKTGVSFAAAIAGSVALSTSNNATRAYIDGGTVIDHSRNLTVQSLSGGQQTTVGIAVALNATADATKSAAAAGSVSLAQVNDATIAFVDGSDINGLATGAGNLAVNAYQRSDIGIGGGSLYGGGKSGFGFALTYAEVSNPSGGPAVEARVSATSVSDFARMDVISSNIGRIVAGSASGGYSQNAVAGAVVITDIGTTVNAKLTGVLASPAQLSSVGVLTVRVDGASSSAKDSAIDSAFGQATPGATSPVDDSSFDFSAQDLGLGASGSARILAVAGLVQAGKNNAGMAMVDNHVHVTRTAEIVGVNISNSAADVKVEAIDEAGIAGIAVGLGLSSGTFGGKGSIALNRIENLTTARVGGTGATTTNTIVLADNLNVTATSSGFITTGAGAISLGTGNATLGLSSIVNEIASSATAEIVGARVDAASDVIVNATTTGGIKAVALGVAISQNIGLAGSSIANEINNSVTARIAGGASVKATDNAAIIALNDQTVLAVAGALGVGMGTVGLGASVVVNQLGGTTTAAIDGSTTLVDALATDTARGLAVNNGVLVSAPNVATILTPTAVMPNLAEQQATVVGLSVSASSHQAVVTNAVSAGASNNVAVGAVTVANEMSGATNARVSAASIGSRIPTGEGQTIPSLHVSAGSHSYAANFAIGFAASGSIAGSAAAASNHMGRTTSANVDGATVTNVANAAVRANASQSAASLVVGFAGAGTGGAAASGIVNLFDADTSATLAGGSFSGNSLAVTANSASAFGSSAGSLAGGGSAGVAASFIVGLSENSTRASIGRTGATTTLTVPGDVPVDAASTVDQSTLAIGGAGAGAAGVSGMASVIVLRNDTAATITDTRLNDGLGSDNPTQDVTVAARETIGVTAKVGGASIGGTAGVGGSANVIIMAGGVNAAVSDSQLTLGGVLKVDADSAKSVDALTIAGAAGGTAGIGAAVGVISIGRRIGGDALQELDSGGSGTLSSADAMSRNSAAGASVSSRLAAATSDAVSATIAGGTIDAGRAEVTSDGLVGTSNRVTGVAVGGTLAGGAGVAYTDVNGTVVAIAGAGTTSVADISVSANAGDVAGKSAAFVQATAGSGALTAAVGAAVGVGGVNNTVSAAIGGNITSSGGSARVRSSDSSSVDVRAIGATVALTGGAIGVSVGLAEKNSNVASAITSSSTMTGFSAGTISAESAGNVSGQAIAGAGGLGFAGTGAGATAKDESQVDASVGAGSTIAIGSAGLNISATATPQTDAEAIGVVVSGSNGLGASVAIATAAPTVTAQVGNNARLTGGGLSVSATVGVPAGSHNASSNSIAGAGAMLFSGNASIAQSQSNSTVAARIGNNVVLPDGDVSVSSSNTTSQTADATGVGVGYFAAGASVAQASSSGSSAATIGSGVTTTAQRSGALSVRALGNETNTADAVAGTGGVIAGNASVAMTENSANVSAGIGAGSVIIAGQISVGAEHFDYFQPSASSVNAAAVGASGAGASHDSNATTLVSIGTNAVLAASAADPIVIGALNHFIETGGKDSANAAAGGVLNGSAAVSRISISGSASVDIGSGANISSGTNPVDVPGGIKVLAVSTMNVVDNVSLTTGGLIQGAGVDSRITATLDNIVNVGANSRLSSLGNIGIGTYSNLNASANAGVSTYGLAAVGVAIARSDLTSNQTITIAGGARVSAFGNVDITAGQEPTGIFDTIATASANASGYVRGFIAIPDATATANVTSNTTLNIASGSTVESAQNVRIGAYHGVPIANADGTARGYELGFIPVTSHDSNRSAVSTGTVRVDGNVTAGVYHDLRIVIDCGATICGAGSSPVLTQISGAPAGAVFSPTFDLQAYIADNFDSVEAATLAQGASTTPVPTYLIGQLFAAGGTVTINADTLAGAGTVTSYGGPTISVQNNSAASIIVGGAYIPDTPGGRVIFTGAAGRAQAGNVHLVESIGAGPSIELNNAYSGAPAGTGGFGPALLVVGNITNLGGSVRINNETGSYGLRGNLNAQQINITIPQGVAVISATDASGLYSAGASPFSEWNSFIYYPGGNPANGVPSANAAVAFAANLDYPSANGNELNNKLVHANSSGEPNNYSKVYFGMCSRRITGNCSEGYANSFFGGSIHFASEGYIPYVPYYDTSVRTGTYANASLTGSQNSAQVFGTQVAIRANIININGKIEIGRPTDRSVQLSTNLLAPVTTGLGIVGTGFWGIPIFGQVASGGEISVARYNYQRGINTGTPVVLKSVTATSATGTVIKAKYDPVADVISLDDVDASSSGGELLLHGQIISTNPLGRIHVNGGLGQVDIQNQTGVKLVVNRVNTGNVDGGLAPTSTIKIVDLLQPNATNTTTYIFTPGTGINAYRTGNGTDPILSGGAATAPFYTTSGTATQYNPLQDVRFQWAQYATLSRRAVTDNNGYDYDNNQNRLNMTNWTWNFPTGQPNNPWQFVTSTGGLANQSNPQGSLVVEAGQPVFKQSFSGGTSNNYLVWARYHGCSPFGFICNYGFKLTGFNDRYQGDWYAEYFYRFPQFAWLRTTTSVKADNPFTIDFSGIPTGRINISSVGGVTFAGQVNNPSGPLSTTSTAGAISQTPQSSILTKDLTLNAAGAVGSATRPISGTMVADGTLSGNSGAGFYVNLNSGAKLGSIITSGASAGDISIRATGDLLDGGAGNPSNLRGGNITLSTTNGSIGTSSAPINMTASNSTDASGALQGGIVDIVAHGDIALNASGTPNLRVKQIVSNTGNVSVTVPTGAILDASGQTSGSGLSASQLQEVSRRLHLTAADGAVAHADSSSVTPFETLVNSNYARYFQMLSQGMVSGGTFTLNSGALALWEPIAKQALQISGTPTAQQIQSYADSQFQDMAATFTRAFGAGWSSRPDFQARNPGFNFVATAQQRNDLTRDAVWSAGQLASAIDRAALQPSSGVVGNAVPNIVGRDVTVVANGAIGKLLSPITIAMTDLRNGTLTQDQQAALGVATAPGSVKAFGTDAVGNTVEIADISNIASGLTLTGFRIAQTDPLFVNSTGTFNASSQGSVYIQATSSPQTAGATLTIGQVSGKGEVSIVAPQSIMVALDGNGIPVSSTQVSTTGNLSLVAGLGSIGSAQHPLTFAIGGQLTSVAAGQDAYLASLGGMQVGRVFAQGTASLTSAGALTGTLPGVSIAAGDIALNITGNAGSGTTALQLQLAPGGVLSGTVGGMANIYSPTLSGQAPVLLNVDNLSTNGDLTLTSQAGVNADRISSSGGAIVVAAGTDAVIDRASAGSTFTGTAVGALQAGTITAANQIQLSSGGDLTITANAFVRSIYGGVGVVAPNLLMATDARIASTAQVSINVTGAATLGRIRSSFNPGTLAPAVTISANTVSGNGDGQTNIVASFPNAQTSIIATGNIGASTLQPLSVVSNQLSASSSGGDINLSIPGNAHGVSVAAPQGSVSIVGVGILAFDTISALGTVDVSSSAGALTVGTVTSGGNQSLAGSTGVTLTQLTSSGTVTVGSVAGNVSGGSISATGNVSVTARDNNTGSSVQSSAGSVSLSGGTLVNWGSITSSGALTVASALGNISTTTMSSVGDMTLTAAGNIGFSSLTSTSGNVFATSTSGNIAGNSVGARNHASLTANAGQVQVTTTTATTGAAAVSGDTVFLTTVNAGGTTALTSTGTMHAITTVSAGGVTVNSGGDLVFSRLESQTGGVSVVGGGTILGGNLIAAGAASVDAAGALDVSVVNAGLTASTLSRNGAANLGTVTSSGDQTHGAAGNLSFTSLNSNLGSVNATAGATLSGNQVAASNNVSLASTGGTMNVAQIVATNGAVSASANGTLTLPSVNAGSTVSLSSTAGAAALGTVRSGGAQVLQAFGLLGYDLINSGAGASLVSASGSINGNSGSASITAAGTTTLTAANGGILGTNITVVGGDLTMSAANRIQWSDLRSTGLASVTSTAGDLVLANARGDAGLALSAATGITYGSLSSGGALTAVTTSGNIAPQSGLSAISATGNITLNAAGTISGASVNSSGGAILQNAGGAISWSSVNAGTSVDLTSTGAGVALGISTSGGDQTFNAAGNISLVKWISSGGNVDVSTSGGSITSPGVHAALNARLSAASGTVVVNALNSFGGSSTVNAGGNVSLTAVQTGGTLDVTGGTGLTIGTATSGATQTLTAAGNIGFGQLTTTAGNVVVTSTGGNISGTTIGAASNATIGANGTVTLTNLTSGGSSTVNAPGAIDLTTVQTGGTLDVTGGAGLSIGTATSGGTQTLTAANNVTFGQLATTAGNVVVTSTGGNINGATLGAASNATIGANGTVTLANLTSGGASTVNAPGAIDLTTVQTGGTLNVTGGAGLSIGTATSGATQTLTAANNVTFGQLATTAGNVVVTSTGGNINGATLGAASNATIGANGTVTLTNLTSGGASTVNAPGAIDLTTVQTGGTLNVTGGAGLTIVTATSGGTQTLTAAGNVGFGQLTTTAGNVVVTSTGGNISGTTIGAASNATIGANGTVTIASLTSGGSSAVNAPGAIDLTTLQTGGTLDVTGGAGLTIGTAASGATQTLTAAGNVGFGQLTTTAGNVVVTSTGGNISGTTLGAASNATIGANGSVTLANLTSGAASTVTAPGAIDLTTVQPGGTLDVTGGAGLTIGTAASGATQTLTAANNVTFGQLATTAGNVVLTSTGGNINGATLGAASNATIGANGTVTLANLTSGAASTVNAPGAIDLTTVQTGGTLNVTGGAGLSIGTATSGATQTLTAANNVTFGQLATTAGNVVVTSTGGNINGATLGAASNATIGANGTVTLTNLTSGGASTVNALGAIDLTTVQTGGTLNVIGGAGLTIGTATSGATQTLTAANNVSFGQLTTTAGNVVVTSTANAIAGGSILAAGNAELDAFTDNTGNRLEAGGSALLRANGLIDWNMIISGTTLDVAGGGGLTIGTATSGGTQTLTAAGNVGFGQLTTTAGNVVVTSTGGSINGTTLGAASNATIGANGTVTIASLTSGGASAVNAPGAIDLTTVQTGGTLDVTGGAGLSIGTATSGATQTLTAANNVTFGQLTTTAGNVVVTSTANAIAGGSILAAGNAVLDAFTDNTGNRLEAGGSAQLRANGLINWNTIASGTTLDVAGGAGLTIGTATSGGTQTLTAANNVSFGQLTTTAGNVVVTSTGGSISGTTLGAATNATIGANGTVTLTNLTSGAASTVNAQGAIDLTTVQTGGTLDVTSGAGLTIGTATSGATQTLTAAGNVGFDQLTTTAGNVVVTSTGGAIAGSSIVSASDVYLNGNGISFVSIAAGNNASLISNGDVIGNNLYAARVLDLKAGGSGTVDIKTVTAWKVDFSTPGTLIIDHIGVSNSLDLRASRIVANIQQQPDPAAPGAPIRLNVTGYEGKTARSATLFINARNVVFDMLRATSVDMVTTSPVISILDGFTQAMRLRTPTQIIEMDNRSPTPRLGNTLQLHQPGGAFHLTAVGIAIATNAYVVSYGRNTASTVTNYRASHVDGAWFAGSSLVRDILRDMRNGGAIIPAIIGQPEVFGGPMFSHIQSRPFLFAPAEDPIEVTGGPAVNFGGR